MVVQKANSRVKSGTEYFLRPGEPANKFGKVLEKKPATERSPSENHAAGASPGSPSSANSPASVLSPGSAAYSVSTTAPFSPRSRLVDHGEEKHHSATTLRCDAGGATAAHKAEFGHFDLLCLGGTIESLAAATEAATLNAKVCLVEPFAGRDDRAVFRLALRSCLRRALGAGLPGQLSFEELRQERTLYLERVEATRRALVAKGATVLTCTTSSFQNQRSAPKSPHRNGAHSPRQKGEGVAYTPRYGVRHPGGTRGARGTWWSSMPPDSGASQEEPNASEREGLHVMLENVPRAKTGFASATSYLIAAGERSLIHGGTERLEGRELCRQPEELLEALTPQGSKRICIIGTSWTAVELCAFCELAGAEVTWFLEQVDARLGQDHLVEMLPRLVHNVKSRGRTQVHTDFNSRFVRVIQRGSEGALSPRSGQERNEKLLYVQAKHSGADCCGPFDVVVLFGKNEPVMLGINNLPGVQMGTDGRLLIDPNGAAGPQISAIGEVATPRQVQASSKHDVTNVTGISAFGNDEHGLLSQGRYFAKLLFGGPDIMAPVAPALRITTALSYPPVGLVGLSGDEARSVFPAPDWSVNVSFSRHELLGGICGHFVVGLTCVQKAPFVDSEGDNAPFVVGAALLAESGGLPLISGLLLGFAVSVEGKVSQTNFDRILAAYPLTDQGQ